MAVTVTAVFWAVRVQGAHGMSNHIWVHAWQRSYGAQHSGARPRAYDKAISPLIISLRRQAGPLRDPYVCSASLKREALDRGREKNSGLRPLGALRCGCFRRTLTFEHRRSPTDLSARLHYEAACSVNKGGAIHRWKPLHGADIASKFALDK